MARAEAREEETRAAEGEKLTLRVRDKSNGYVPLRLPMYPVAEPGEVRSVIGALPRLHTISSPRSGVGREELVRRRAVDGASSRPHAVSRWAG